MQIKSPSFLQILSYPLVQADKKGVVSHCRPAGRSQGKNSIQAPGLGGSVHLGFVWHHSDAVDRANKESFQRTSL